MKIEICDHNKSEICEKIIRSLPQWFGIESAILDYIKDAERMPMIVAKVESEIIGFLSLNHHNKYTSEIHVMGIIPKFHRLRIGSELVKFAENYLCDQGYHYLSVKTLSESMPNEEYDKTRNFYFGVGFLPIEEFKTLWGEHNPCLLLIKNIAQGI